MTAVYFVADRGFSWTLRVLRRDFPTDYNVGLLCSIQMTAGNRMKRAWLALCRRWQWWRVNPLHKARCSGYPN